MPFAVHVEYLTGYAVAATPGGEAEWPPHPARLFMALVASVHETGSDVRQLNALRWLEQQQPPAIHASPGFERSRPDVFVPPNDAESPRKVADKLKPKDIFAKMLVLPQYRTNRQPRTFARFRPDEPTVAFVWDAEPGEHAEPLADACRAVARLGHSASLVQCWLGPDVPSLAGRDRWEPDPRGGQMLRVPCEGALEDLDARFSHDTVEAFFAKPPRKLKRGETPPTPPTRLRPAMRSAVGYRKADDTCDAAATVFDAQPYILSLRPVESTYRFLSAAKGPEVCQRLREALLSHAAEPVPSVLSGHASDGAPLTKPHVALMPVIDAAGPHPRGHLLGVAVALPRDIDRAERLKVLHALGQVTELRLGDLGVWGVSVTDAGERRYGLKPETWTAADAGATCWATVTPISLDRHTKAKSPAGQQDEIASIIRRACERIGLHAPVRIVPLPTSPFKGAPNGYDYPRLRRKDGSKRRQTHAMLWFDEPVSGPVLLGAGRYRGWGVCRPYVENRK